MFHSLIRNMSKERRLTKFAHNLLKAFLYTEPNPKTKKIGGEKSEDLRLRRIFQSTNQKTCKFIFRVCTNIYFCSIFSTFCYSTWLRLKATSVKQSEQCISFSFGLQGSICRQALQRRDTSRIYQQTPCNFLSSIFAQPQ